AADGQEQKGEEEKSVRLRLANRPSDPGKVGEVDSKDRGRGSENRQGGECPLVAAALDQPRYAWRGNRGRHRGNGCNLTDSAREPCCIGPGNPGEQSHTHPGEGPGDDEQGEGRDQGGSQTGC